jgi:hypothetical protein
MVTPTPPFTNIQGLANAYPPGFGPYIGVSGDGIMYQCSPGDFYDYYSLTAQQAPVYCQGTGCSPGSSMWFSEGCVMGMSLVILLSYDSAGCPLAVTLGAFTDSTTTTPNTTLTAPPVTKTGKTATTQCLTGYRANSSATAPYATQVVQTCVQVTSTTAAWTNDFCVCEFNGEPNQTRFSHHLFNKHVHRLAHPMYIRGIRSVGHVAFHISGHADRHRRHGHSTIVDGQLSGICESV